MTRLAGYILMFIGLGLIAVEGSPKWTERVPEWTDSVGLALTFIGAFIFLVTDGRSDKTGGEG